MLDDQPRSNGIQNLISIPAAVFSGIFPIDGSSHELAALIGILTMTSLIAWDKLKRGRAKLIPGALVGVVLGSAVATVFQLPVKYVKVPENLLDAVSLPSFATLSLLADPALITTAVALAFIASAETLLSAGAVDRMQTLYKTDYDRELTAQGVGNALCGVLGALPMTGVIVRSSANVQAGAKTRLSAMLHAVWLLAFVGILPALLRMIPTAALGAILVYTGYKLVDVKVINVLKQYGRFPVVIYASTVIMIVATDLLTGVMTGIVLSVVKLIYTVTYLEIRTKTAGQRVDIDLIGTASFVKLPKIAAALESVPRDAQVHIDIHRLVYIDHTCLDMMTSWREQHQKNGGQVIVEWDGLHRRFDRIAHPVPPRDDAESPEARLVTHGR
jgi:MFS superfamily sulfate permease-like transporter